MKQSSDLEHELAGVLNPFEEAAGAYKLALQNNGHPGTTLRDYRSAKEKLEKFLEDRTGAARGGLPPEPIPEFIGTIRHRIGRVEADIDRIRRVNALPVQAARLASV